MATTTTTTGNPSISFNENTFPSREAAPKSSVDYSDAQPTFDPEAEFEAEEERLHPQDWTKSTAAHESYGAKQLRKMSVFSKIDDDVSQLKKARAMSGSNERRGSILSTWVAGKDKDGKDILKHGFEDESAIDDEGGEVLVKVTSKEKGPEDIFRDRAGFEHRRLSSKGGQERRGSILSVWKGGKDKDGNHVLMHDDEEWKV